MSKILSIIPARSGSKSIPDKNIQSLRGLPLIAHTIKHSFASKLINRTIVSTDSRYYADIASSFGAEVPFLRPEEHSTDSATDYEVFRHALEWLSKNEGYEPDILVHLRPTTPVRNIYDIDAMIEMLIKHPQADSIRSVVKNEETVYKMWFMDENNFLTPVTEHTEFPEAYNLPRQHLPMSYLQNASIDVTRRTTIIEQKSMTGSKILGYPMEKTYDIDFREQLENISFDNFLDDSSLTFVIDIDGVIAHLAPNNDYTLAKPNEEVIAKINKLFEKGHIIILFTARGSKTNIDWREVTIRQMTTWGVKYNELRLGKPFADFYVDDRLLSINDILKLKI